MKSSVVIIASFAFASASFAQNVAVQTKPLDPGNMDTSVPACVDFFRYANGGWLGRAAIPADQSTWGSFSELSQRNRTNLRLILERARLTRTTARDSDTRRLGTFYAACMDSVSAERVGARPLQAALRRIGRIATARDVQRELARMHNAGIGAAFAFGSAQDRRRSTDVIATARQGGLTLPDREYYLRPDSSSRALRAAYETHIASLLGLAGIRRADAERDARAVMELETALARASRARADLRDAARNYNRMTLGQLDSLTRTFDWRTYFTDRGRADIAVVDVGQPEFFAAVDSLLRARPVSDWRSYLRWRLVKSGSPLLSDAFVNEDFAFDRRTSGAQALAPRWVRCVRNADAEIGDILGRAYVADYFPPEAKTRALEMIRNLRAAFRDRIATRQWMTDETRARAYAKLDAFTEKIGYPDRWPDNTALRFSPGASFYDVVSAARTHERRRALARIGRPVDRAEWGFTTPTVNASYSATRNEITFPAGILQPPFFDPNADDAVNYGGIGAVIGHELSHGFDDQGSRYDAAGNLENWWTDEDRRRFEERTGLIVSQFDSYTVLDTVHVRGRLTLGENIADLGGLSLAYAALQRALQGKPRETIDGFTPEQRFFLAWAQIWRRANRPEYALRQILTDSHSPAQWRVNGPLSNMAEFAAAFSCREGDPMVRPTAQRAEIW